jgi:glycosyltransferase involved in cell wall biosynthesis
LRQALWLLNNGHEVSAVSVEDIEAQVPSLEAKHDTFMGLEIERLYFNRLNYPNVLEASHYNPEIRDWLRNHLKETRPDIMLVNACYLLGVGILEAARELGIPVVVTLHDFWFLCQRLTLMRPDGSLCNGKVSAEDCALCISKDLRRNRLLDKYTAGLVGKALVAGAKSGNESFAKLLGGRQKIETLALRRNRLIEALKNVEVIISPSQYLKRVYVENGVPEDKITYIRYGLDSERMRDLTDRGFDKPATPGGLRVGYLGQVLPHKGVHVLVKAFRLLKNERATLRIYGQMGRDKAYDTRLRKLAEGDARITFEGAYNANELPGILNRLDTIVVPSVWHENSPLVIMEAKAAGLPVITSNFGGMAEMVAHNNDGLLFRLGDYQELARQLQRLSDEPGLLKKLGEGIAPIKTLDQEFEELLPIYNRLMVARR